MSSFKASAVIFQCKKYSPDRRSVGGGDSAEVTALEAFTGPTAFKKGAQVSGQSKPGG